MINSVSARGLVSSVLLYFTAATVCSQTTAGTPSVEKIDATRYRVGSIEIDSASREVSIPCRVCQREVPLEYALVHETGKDHESLLITSARPLELQVALLLAGLRPGSLGLFANLPEGMEPLFAEVAPEIADAHRCALELEWTQGPESQRVGLHEWIRLAPDDQAPPDLWLFSGSITDEQGFAAENEGSIVALYADQKAILQSTSAANVRDDLWSVETAKVPAIDTHVKLIIRPWPSTPVSPASASSAP